MSLKNKLNRLKPHLVVSEKKNEVQKALLTNKEQEIPYIEEWTKANVRPYYFDNSYCLIREVTYPLTHQHGKYCFKDLFTVVQAWNNTNIKHPLSAEGHNPNELFFFDTETTGLGGGAGNTIFLLGHASVSETHVTLKQHILPHPGAEIPLYQSFLESVDYKTLVTYNGKAFDWPQVKTRHTLIRDHVPKLPAFGHFDLYHAARRMWKHKLDKLKLSRVENEVLGFERKDDIPGFLAPIIYFDFIERKNPEGLLGVIKHNEMDILSLISLYIHLSFQLLRLDGQQTAKETYEVGRWYASLGQSVQAKQAFSDLLSGVDDVDYQAMNALAFEYKRECKWLKAEELWKKVAEDGPLLLQVEACIELAKIYEHRIKNIEMAYTYCERAKQSCSKITDKKKLMKYANDSDKRMLRLTIKLAKDGN
ncbi:ribonuclease H-like domain-containing protein [Bacillus marasmi]|uniref:ribonuclease H-like domain-containing protein n=1 Tax=Bacillus marasmi TaxID=1926279 RepID=UPI0011C9F612|nr:ribonuclease H-like domain-containing protein [Bacillus marasmi]